MAAASPIASWSVDRRIGVVPFAVELRKWRPPVSPTNSSMLRHVSNHAVGRGQRIKSNELAGGWKNPAQVVRYAASISTREGAVSKYLR